MESSFKQEIKVGIFVLLGLVVGMGSILLLGGDQMFLRPKYKLYVTFDQVQGLARGSIVSLAGLPIGNVSNLDFKSDSRSIRITMNLDRSYSDRITDLSYATVKTQGALGDRYIYIEPGPPGGKSLTAGDTVHSEAPRDLMDIIAQRGDDLGEVVEVIKEVHILLRALNDQNRSTLLMNNMVTSSSELTQLLRETRNLVRDIRGQSANENKLQLSLTHLTNILKKLDEGEGTLGAIINDPALHERLMSLIGESPRNQFLKPLIRETIRSHEQAN